MRHAEAVGGGSAAHRGRPFGAGAHDPGTGGGADALGGAAWGESRSCCTGLAVNVRAVRSLAESYGFGAEIDWEPSLAGKTQHTAYEERAAAEARLPRDWIRGVDERVRRAWAAAGADDLVYLGDLFAQTREPRFVDGSHTSEAANREVAATIGQHLRVSGRLR